MSSKLLIILNAIVLILGIAVAVTCVLLATNIFPSDLSDGFDANSDITMWGYELLGLGLGVMVAALVGLFAAFINYRCLLWTYVIIALILTVCEIGLGVYLAGQVGDNSWTSPWNDDIMNAVVQKYPSDPGSWHKYFSECPPMNAAETHATDAAQTCAVGVLNEVKHSWYVIGVVCLALSSFQLIILILSCVVICRTPHQRDDDDIEMQKP